MYLCTTGVCSHWLSFVAFENTQVLYVGCNKSEMHRDAPLISQKFDNRRIKGAKRKGQRPVVVDDGCGFFVRASL